MITLQNIHLVKLPPMENIEPPSNRKAMPASTRQISAIAGRSWRRRRTMSARICGIGMLDLLERMAAGLRQQERSANAEPAESKLRYTSGSLQNPKLEQTGDARYRQQHR